MGGDTAASASMRGTGIMKGKHTLCGGVASSLLVLIFAGMYVELRHVKEARGSIESTCVVSLLLQIAMYMNESYTYTT